MTPVPGDPHVGALPAGQERAALVAEVGRVLARIPEAAVVVVATSGGPDSGALAFLTAEARPDLTLVLVHIRHGLRTDVDDLQAVTRQASHLGQDLVVEQVTVEPDGQGVEAAARRVRYAALRRAGRAAEAGWLLIGHTADDQAETVLQRLARGAGLDGLGAMPAVRGDVIRPLLRLRRADVHAFVAGDGVPTSHDPSNDDRRFGRNQVRHVVVPALLEVAPDPVGALTRLADLARDDAELLDQLTAARIAEVVRRVGPVHACRLDDVAAASPALGRRIVRHMVVGARDGGNPPSATQTEQVRALVQGGCSLPGVDVTAAGGWLTCAPDDLDPDGSAIVAPGDELHWWAFGWRLVVSDAESLASTHPAQLALLDGWAPPDVTPTASLVPGADPSRGQVVLGGLGQDRRLLVRPWQSGDRIRMAGGTRKLSDVFGDAGVPRSLRPVHPVVTTPDGDRVLWVPGLAADNDALQAGYVHPDVHLVVHNV